MGNAALKSIAEEEYHKVVEAPEPAATPLKKQVKKTTDEYTRMMIGVRSSNSMCGFVLFFYLAARSIYRY